MSVYIKAVFSIMALYPPCKRGTGNDPYKAFVATFAPGVDPAAVRAIAQYFALTIETPMTAIANTKQGIVLVQLCPRRRSAQNQSRILKNEFEKQFKIQVQEVTELTNFEMETVLEWSPILATAEDIEVAMAKEGWDIGELYSLIPAARLEASMKYQCYDHLAPLSSLDKALAIKDTDTMKAIMPDIAPQVLMDGYKPLPIEDKPKTKKISLLRPDEFDWLSDEEPMQGDDDYVPTKVPPRKEPEPDPFTYAWGSEANAPADAPTWEELHKQYLKDTEEKPEIVTVSLRAVHDYEAKASKPVDFECFVCPHYAGDQLYFYVAPRSNESTERKLRWVKHRLGKSKEPYTLAEFAAVFLGILGKKVGESTQKKDCLELYSSYCAEYGVKFDARTPGSLAPMQEYDFNKVWNPDTQMPCLTHGRPGFKRVEQHRFPESQIVQAYKGSLLLQKAMEEKIDWATIPTPYFSLTLGELGTPFPTLTNAWTCGRHDCNQVIGVCIFCRSFGEGLNAETHRTWVCTNANCRSRQYGLDAHMERITSREYMKEGCSIMFKKAQKGNCWHKRKRSSI